MKPEGRIEGGRLKNALLNFLCGCPKIVPK